MNTFAAVVVLAQEMPGNGMVDRLGETVQGFASALIFVAFLVFAVVIMFTMLPRWAGGLIGLMLLASVFTAPGAWWEWITYVAAGSEIETTPTTPTTPTASTLVPGGGG